MYVLNQCSTWSSLLYMNSWPGYKHYFHLQLHIYFVDIGIKQKSEKCGGPPSLIYPRRRTHLKYAAPWTYERVGRYSHSYITSYKLNFSSSPLFKLLQYFPSRFSWNCPRVKSVCEDFTRRSFLRTIWLKVFIFCLKKWKHKYAYGLPPAFGKIGWPCVSNEILFSLQPHVYRNNSDAYTWFFCKFRLHLC